MGLFQGVENAIPSNGGVYITEGIYPDIEVLGHKVIVSRKKETMFVLEGLVHASSGPKALQPGTKFAWMLKANNDAFLGNVRAHAKACAEALYKEAVPLADVDESACELMVSPEQPFKGVRLKAQATNIQTKAMTPFTKVEWDPRDSLRDAPATTAKVA